jgi:sulfate transport system ATP-binding protein
MKIEVKNCSKAYGAFHALRDVTVEVPPGELVRCSVLRVQAKRRCCASSLAWKAADSGSCFIRTTIVTERSARERNVGLSFQHTRVYHSQHLREHRFGLRVRASGKVMRLRTRRARLAQTDSVGRFGRNGIRRSYRAVTQRVGSGACSGSIAAIALLDEPFGALDATSATRTAHVVASPALRAAHHECF